jgi:ferredoxin
LIIDPEICVDCDLCVPECPVDAIFSEDNVPEKWAHFKALNEKLAQELPTISEQKDPPADADQWKGVEPKEQHLDPTPPDA